MIHPGDWQPPTFEAWAPTIPATRAGTRRRETDMSAVRLAVRKGLAPKWFRHTTALLKDAGAEYEGSTRTWSIDLEAAGPIWQQRVETAIADGHIDIVTEQATIDRAELEAERRELVRRLAEIDKLLES